MVELYVDLIKKGLKTIEDVPLRWRDAVRVMVEAEPLVEMPSPSETYPLAEDSAVHINQDI